MPCHIVILGGGISGLSCAWYLKKKFGSAISITILEKSPRVGGWIQTDHCEGFLFEQGPHSCRSKGNGIKTLQLVEELDLQDQLIVADPSAQYRYLYYQQQLQKLPHNKLSFFVSPLTKGMTAALFRDIISNQKQLGDISVYDYFTGKMSPELTERFIDPLISGIYAGDMRKLSLRSCFPDLFHLQQQYGSIVRGLLLKPKKKQMPLSSFVENARKSPIFSFQNGLQTLTNRLAERVEANICLNCEPQSLTLNAQSILVNIKNSSPIQADYLISTIPAYGLGNLLSTSQYNMKQDLEKISYANVAVINVGYHQDVLKRKGFGYLIPHQEGEDILGCIWDSSVFPQQNENHSDTRLTVMMGGIRSPQAAFQSEQECCAKALGALAKHLGIECLPDAISIKMAIKAIPQYDVGYQFLKNHIYSQMASVNPRFILGGQAFNGLSVNDNIAGGLELANNFIVQF